MRAVYFTDKGKVREKNEDALAVFGNAITEDLETPCEISIEDETKAVAAFVIDGLGGHFGGKCASSIVAETLASSDVETLLNDTRGVFEAAKQKMRDAAKENQKLSKMGATFAGLVLHNGSVTVFNCGDCRVYRLRGGVLEKLTHDHSIVQELFDAGRIDDDQMRRHKQKNIVTSALMPFEGFQLYTRSYTTRENDVFFICSDGVWETVSLGEIGKCLSEGQDLSRYLLDNAPCADNVSYIILKNN